jgi:hypothetical protein
MIGPGSGTRDFDRQVFLAPATFAPSEIGEANPESRSGCGFFFPLSSGAGG